MLSIKEVIANVVYNEMNQLIPKNDIYDLLDEIILTQDTTDPLFRLIGYSNDTIYYVCFTHNSVIVINALTNYLNHSEDENRMLAHDIFSAITCNEEIDYECFVNTEVDDEYSPLISASNSSEIISIQRSLPELSMKVEMKEEQVIERNDDNCSCLLCYEKSEFCCSRCNYPMCSNCISIIGNSSCKCPCCQYIPLQVAKIK